MDFAVVDVETTGLFPRRHDRIVEIAIVRVDAHGKMLDEFTSLINPQRDIGPQHIHGLTARDVSNAPLFEDIAGHLIPLLRGAVFTAHNVHFDKRFVAAEFMRMNAPLPPMPLLCTLRISRFVNSDVNSRRLADLCCAFGISLKRKHCAHTDAIATAQLLTYILKEIGDEMARDVLRDALADAAAKRSVSTWPNIAPRVGPLSRRHHSAVASSSSLISKLIAKLPPSSNASVEATEYLSLLDRALEDRILTVDEAQALTELATELHLGPQQVMSLHEEYLDQIITLALRDHIVSKAEEKDLEYVAELLGIGNAKLEQMLKQGEAERSRPKQRQDLSISARDVLQKTICFTGESNHFFGGEPLSRTIQERAAETSGMIPKKSVTKKLDFLVASDAHSMSGKAKKARLYGIRILAESVFWQMVGIDPSDEKALRALTQRKR